MLATARENLQPGASCIVVGPFLREVRAHELADRRWPGIADEVTVHVVRAHLQEQEGRRRIMARANPDDAWELSHRADHHTRLFMPDAREYPGLLPYDDTRALSGRCNRSIPGNP